MNPWFIAGVMLTLLAANAWLAHHRISELEEALEALEERIDE